MTHLSVIIPTRNRAAFLKDALSSLAAQTVPADRFEVVVVDNGSDDGTKELCESFPGRIRNFGYVYDDRPGLHVGRHAGLKAAKGGILVFADDDIEAFPTWLEGISESFRDETVALAGGKILPKYEAEPPDWVEGMWTHDRSGTRYLLHLSLLDSGDEKKYIDPEYVFGCNFSIRKPVLLEAGGFHPDAMPPERIRYRGDGESHVSRHVARKGYRALYHPKASVYHKVPSGRLTEEYFRRRAYCQGISDSYTRIRDERLGGAEAPRVREGIPRYRELLREMTREAVGAAGRKMGRILRGNATGRFADVQRRIEESYREGWRFHRDETARDPELLEWVLKESYLGS